MAKNFGQVLGMILVAFVCFGCSKPQSGSSSEPEQSADAKQSGSANNREFTENINAGLHSIAALKEEIGNLRNESAPVECYAVDNGKLLKLAPERACETQLSPKACFILVFGNKYEAKRYFLLDWEFLAEKDYPKISVTQEIPGLQNAIAVLPKNPLQSGIYSVCAGQNRAEYPFWVQISDEAEYWKKVARLHPNSWQAHNHLGAVFFTKQDFDSALEHFKRGVELNPDNCEVQNNLGLALATKGSLEEAAVHYGKAMEIKGDDPSIRTNYANTLTQLKRYDAAVLQYKRALRNAYGYQYKSGIYIHLGHALCQAGRLIEAKEAYTEALKIDPKSQDAKSKLEFVEEKLRQSGTN